MKSEQVRCDKFIGLSSQGKPFYCRKLLADVLDDGLLIIECPRCRYAGRDYKRIVDRRLGLSVA